jgi:ligand-binding sensor domain-containing protein
MFSPAQPMTEAGLPTENDNVRALAIDASDNIFAGTEGGLFRSVDNGNTWSPVFSAVNAFAINSDGNPNE